MNRSAIATVKRILARQRPRLRVNINDRVQFSLGRLAGNHDRTIGVENDFLRDAPEDGFPDR